MKTNNANLKNLAEEIKSRPILTRYLTPANKRGYVCIGCGNGSGDDGTGADVNDDETRLLCGKCQKGFSNIDVIANHLGISTTGKDFFNVVKFGCQEFGLPFVDSDETATIEKFDKLEESQESLANFVNNQGGKWRGLSLETLQRGNAGFLPDVYFSAAGKKLPAIVIPNDLGGVYFRSIQGKFHKNNKPMATTTVFLPASDSFDLIITEGQINALSILQAVPNPKFGVMACSGTSGENNILAKLKELDSQGKNFRVILAFDFDSNGAGQNAAVNVLKSLYKAGYTACTINITKTDDFDLNDVLRSNNGISKLAKMLDDSIKFVKDEFERIAVEENKKILGKSDADIFPSAFENSLALTARFADRKTGFDNLDKEMVFLPGIYIIGGLPSLGKTTFALQLLEQAAQQGEHCFFCSFEMSENFLHAKRIARRVYQLESNDGLDTVDKPLTATNILTNKFFNHKDNFNDVLESLHNENIPFYIWELDEVDIDKLLARIGKICSTLERPPIVCIDYLQLLACNNEQTKAGIDTILRKLKTFQRSTDTTFIIVSSLNRLNYNNEISFESFKESGGIEYTADVMWGLQFLLTPDEERTTKTLSKAKQENPRKIQLKCLKNRFGANFDVGFTYFSAVDYFKPLSECNYLEFTEPATKNETKKTAEF